MKRFVRKVLLSVILGVCVPIMIKSMVEICFSSNLIELYNWCLVALFTGLSLGLLLAMVAEYFPEEQ